MQVKSTADRSKYMTVGTAAVKPTTSAAKTASATTNQHNFMKKASAAVDASSDY